MLKSNWAILLCFSDLIRPSQPLTIVQGKIRYVIMSLKRQEIPYMEESVVQYYIFN